MKLHLLGTFCLFLSTVVAAAELTEADVGRFMSAYEKALETEHFHKVAPFIHPQAVFRFSEGDFVGLEQIEEAFAKTWALDVENVKYFLSNLRVINVDAESATVVFNWNWQGDSEEGPFRIVGRGTSHIVLLDGQPKLLLEHLSR